jgi:hypothetical protein
MSLRLKYVMSAVFLTFVNNRASFPSASIMSMFMIFYHVPPNSNYRMGAWLVVRASFRVKYQDLFGMNQKNHRKSSVTGLGLWSQNFPSMKKECQKFHHDVSFIIWTSNYCTKWVCFWKYTSILVFYELLAS